MNKIHIFFAIIVMSLLLVLVVCSQTKHDDIVRLGVSFEDAKKILHTQVGSAFYVRINYTTGINFEVETERGWEGVILKNNSPALALSEVILVHDNRFLIKGRLEKILDEESIAEDINANKYTLEVDEWEIVTPIHRKYDYKTNGKMRIFPPKTYLDVFDVENGDYIPQ